MTVATGTERTNKNGYTYIKQADGSWKAKHHLAAEKIVGRPLHKDERVRFKDRNNQNLSLENLEVYVVTSSKQAREAWLEGKIAEYREELNELRARR